VIGQSPGTGDNRRAWVGPHGEAIDVPRAVEHLERLGHLEAVRGERFAQL
jgi:hypothetical protein